MPWRRESLVLLEKGDTSSSSPCVGISGSGVAAGAEEEESGTEGQSRGEGGVGCRGGGE